MKPRYRLAVERDAEQLLELTLRAYEPIRKLGIRFAAAHADLDLVLKNIRENACYVMEEDGRIIATITLRMPWGKQPGPYGVPHIWWFAVDPDTEKRNRNKAASMAGGNNPSRYVKGSVCLTRNSG